MKFALRHDVASREWPPKGGWKYHQPETGWKAPQPGIDGFRETVERIRQHRLANPGKNLDASPEAAARDLEQFTALRILEEAPDQAKKWLLPLDEEATQKKTPRPGLPPATSNPVGAVLVAAIKRLKRDAQGARVLLEWLGSGSKPVAQDRAEERARICAKCPHNTRGHSFESGIAETIRRHESARSHLKLETQVDHLIDTCGKCLCYLRLKVWIPIEKILRDTPPEKLGLPDHCWIVKEQEQSKTQRGKVRLAYHGYVFDDTGFGNAARSYLNALRDSDVRVTAGDPRTRRDRRLEGFDPIDWRSDLHVLHGIPTEFERLSLQPITSVFMTAWETNRMPSAWVPILNRVKEVWVPCEFNRQSFSARLGVPVFVLPHPFVEPGPVVPDPDFIKALGIRDGDFVYYSVFVWQQRKSPMETMEAYFRAFPDDEDRILVIKANPGAREVAPQMLRAAREKTGSKARVSIAYDMWPERRISELHARGDCYVSLHRGEGFALPLFDAACRGNAIVATAYSGPMDFLDPSVHRLVAFALGPVDQSYKYYTSDMAWAYPNVAQAAAHLRIVDDNRREMKGLAAEFAPQLRDRFSSKRIAAMAVERIRQLCG